MRIRFITLLAALVVAVTVVALAQSGPAETMLEAARRLDVVDGDLAGAIKRYQAVVDRFGKTDQAAAATALLGMADCFDRLGKPDARTAYERVVRDYPNQKEPVTKARTWLAGHGLTTAGDVRVERLWTGRNTAGHVSADGRYLAFTDWTGGHGNLAIRDLKTGEGRLLTHDAGPNAWAGDALVSPDGSQVAYRWEGGRDDSIRIIGLDGTRMRVLARREYGDFLRAWSPDGKRIAAIHYNYTTDNTIQIILISTTDGAVTSLKSTVWREPEIGGFSPDGRFLVYSLGKDAAAGPDGVFALAVDGSREAPLVQGASNNVSPVWSPDGRRVFFMTDRSGATELWAINVLDGKPDGSPELVRPNIGSVIPRGFAKDGSYYYAVATTRTDAYIADFNQDDLRVLNPILVTERFVGSNSGPRLSPDGTRVAFYRRSTGPVSIVVRSLASDEEQTLATSRTNGPLHWSADSQSVLVLEYNGTRPRLREFGIGASDPRTLVDFPTPVWQTTALSADRGNLFYTLVPQPGPGTVGPGDKKSIRLVKRRLDTGEETDVYRTESTGLGFFGLAISPDGRSLAFSVNVDGFKRALMVMPIEGGAPREIFRTGADGVFHANNSAIMWTKDGRHLIVATKCGGRTDLRLCAVSPDGGELRPLAMPIQGTIISGSLAEDGRRMAFTKRTDVQELWVIRNLLPQQASMR